jgi:hypothetical protein
MSPVSSPAALIGLVLLLPVALVVGVLTLLTGRSAPVVPDLPTSPQFLAWSGEPYGDGLNHYLVRVADGSVAEGWLQFDDGRLMVDGLGNGFTAGPTGSADLSRPRRRTAPDAPCSAISGNAGSARCSSRAAT